MFRLPLVAFLAASPSLAFAASPLPIQGAKASSYYSEEGNYSAERAIDGKQSTAWVEGDSGSGLGAWIELDLGSEQTVKKIRIWGGDWSSWEYWNRANRPKELEVKYSDGSTQMITLKDEKTAQVFDVDGGGKKTQTVRLRLKSTYSGSTWFDTGISEVQLLGEGDGSAVRGTAKASSTAEEDGDGNYVAANAVDGLFDSMWCEGNKEGDGTGESLEITFDKAYEISKMTLLNGIGSSMSLWMKANQATGLKLTFSDGSSTDVAIERPSFRPTAYDFDVKKTTSVKITVTGVKKGREYNDLCVSEVWFSR